MRSQLNGGVNVYYRYEGLCDKLKLAIETNIKVSSPVLSRSEIAFIDFVKVIGEEMLRFKVTVTVIDAGIVEEGLAISETSEFKEEQLTFLNNGKGKLQIIAGGKKHTLPFTLMHVSNKIDKEGLVNCNIEVEYNAINLGLTIISWGGRKHVQL